MSEAVTLADLIPDGCTEFRYKTPSGILRVALQHPAGHWEVTGLSNTWSSVNDLQRAFNIDLNTVVPLAVDPDWIEAQR